VASSPIDADVVARLAQDVASTVGEQHLALIDHAAESLRVLDPPIDPAKLVDDVQQFIHDLFIDTTWPRCPVHHRHPLWYRDGSWWCDRDHLAVAELGALGRGSPEHQDDSPPPVDERRR
jgi:hypothetical protein